MQSTARPVAAALIGTLLSVALLAGCDSDGGPAHTSFQHFEVNNAALVTIHSRTQSDATVNAAMIFGAIRLRRWRDEG